MVITAWYTPCDENTTLPTGQGKWCTDETERRKTQQILHCTMRWIIDYTVSGSHVKWRREIATKNTEGTAAWFAILHMAETRSSARRRKTRAFESIETGRKNIEV